VTGTVAALPTLDVAGTPEPAAVGVGDRDQHAVGQRVGPKTTRTARADAATSLTRRRSLVAWRLERVGALRTSPMTLTVGKSPGNCRTKALSGGLSEAAVAEP
jgi:hypothetical protein